MPATAQFVVDEDEDVSFGKGNVAVGVFEAPDGGGRDAAAGTFQNGNVATGTFRGSKDFASGCVGGGTEAPERFKRERSHGNISKGNVPTGTFLWGVVTGTFQDRNVLVLHVPRLVAPSTG